MIVLIITGQAARRGTNTFTECRLDVGIVEDRFEEVTFNLNPDELERQRGAWSEVGTMVEKS